MKPHPSSSARMPLFLIMSLLSYSHAQNTYCANMQEAVDYACSNYENDGGIDKNRCLGGTCQQCLDGGICWNTGYLWPRCGNGYNQGCYQVSEGGPFDLWSGNFGDYYNQYWRCDAACTEYVPCELCEMGVSYRVGCGGNNAGECIPCTKCGPGTQIVDGCYPDWDGSSRDSTCYPCQAGYFSASELNYGCQYCMEGSYSDAGATSCTLCSPGFYQSMIIMPYCFQCDIGTYQPSYGATDCIPCQACAGGSYQTGECGGDTSGCSQCSLCGPGTSITGGCSPTDTVDAICTPCGVGEYSNEAHNFACSPCDIGTYQPAAGASSCLACPTCAVGYYRSECGGGNAGQCVKCSNTS